MKLVPTWTDTTSKDANCIRHARILYSHKSLIACPHCSDNVTVERLPFTRRKQDAKAGTIACVVFDAAGAQQLIGRNSMQLSAQAKVHARTPSCRFSPAKRCAPLRSLRTLRLTPVSSADLRYTKKCSLPAHAGLFTLHTWRTHQRIYGRNANFLGALAAALQAEYTVREVRYGVDIPFIHLFHWRFTRVLFSEQA